MNRYIEHIINDLVRDTRIDYDQDRIYFPFLSPNSLIHIFSHPHFTLLHFSDYCKERYGLTEDEIYYVWDQYTSIIKDKITNRES
jgi:hypothetical protein